MVQELGIAMHYRIARGGVFLFSAEVIRLLSTTYAAPPPTGSRPSHLETKYKESMAHEPTSRYSFACRIRFLRHTRQLTGARDAAVSRRRCSGTQARTDNSNSRLWRRTIFIAFENLRDQIDHRPTKNRDGGGTHWCRRLTRTNPRCVPENSLELLVFLFRSRAGPLYWL
ncbi:hypothetical protein K461DRAFT_121174 [Myriangium duriaei CBS 260.36]|uniref:Uncharacterized protein n=1 Tax=Myriangium duriaei CBS 260.36 TaxID=1168546 RepID=A0A9P4J3F0_9PEZI|nr:hypothetical protein K461DRAFT_121174 [Myriangium duriaei CBS 260.36]